MNVVTRFAPSPTGMLHIGNARAALFNWLFARRHGGRYLLRVEDTDRARSTPEAISAILDGLDWLGIGSDEQTVFQFARAAHHRDVAEEMVARGKAFRCYVTPEELDARRQHGEATRQRVAALKAENAPHGDLEAAYAELARATSAFRSPYRDGGLQPPSPDARYVIRLRAPDSGEIVNDDLVQGHVAVKAHELDDLVLVRADKTPVFYLSNAVDDHDMGVTHVIRGDDHLTNTARAIPIFQAMDWQVPAFAHLPLIHGPDGAKLSKRHGAQSVGEYREMGYLPEGVTSYLMRLGWSPGHDDILTLDEAAKVFDLSHVTKAPARLDFTKLASVNAHFMKLADDERLAGTLIDYINTHHPNWPHPAEMRAIFARAMPVLKQRAKTIAELADQAFFLVRARPYTLDGAAQKAMKDDAKALLKRLLARLEIAPDWNVESLGDLIKSFAQDEGVGLGQFGPALRAALTGGSASPDLAQTLFLLGRADAIARLKDHI